MTGKPTPTAQWKKDGENLKQTQRLNSDVIDKDAVLNIRQCDRNDAGVYEITVTNAAGSKTIPIKVSCTLN